MNRRRLLVRADAGGRLGTGHAMRCYAFAQAWLAKHGTQGQVTFLSASMPEAISNRLKDDGMNLVYLDAEPGSTRDVELTVGAASRLLVDQQHERWIMIDGYQFNEDMVRACRGGGMRVLFVDDYGHLDHYEADLVLNQNVYADPSLYADSSEHTGFLLGTRYAQLRKEFAAARQAGGAGQGTGDCPVVMVSMGGSDPDNVTLRILEAIARTGADCRLIVILGGANTHVEKLRSFVRERELKAEIRINESSMSGLMNECDVAVCAAGTTTYELAFMGVPILLVSIADNQDRVAAGMAKQGAAMSLGRAEHLDIDEAAECFADFIRGTEARSRLQENGRLLVDGKGGERVMNAMTGVSLNVRPATEDDALMTLNWTNDPDVRKVSFHPEDISEDTHRKWMAKMLSRKDAMLMIVETEQGEPVGQVRLEGAPESTVSISIAREWRGRGLGEWILRKAVRNAYAIGSRKLNAYIRPDNRASVVAFERAGFVETTPTSIQGDPALHYELLLAS